MSLKQCRECGAWISRSAKACPRCGALPVAKIVGNCGGSMIGCGCLMVLIAGLALVGIVVLLTH
ncbi:MAG: hypothetical protein ABSH08_04015 [Tepidisphaeraceae bacterium]